MSNTILLKRGLDSHLASLTLQLGEPAFVTDTNKLYIGTGASKILINPTSYPSADKWTTARTLTLAGDVTGSVVVDGTTNMTITTVVGDDSHNHSISTINSLQSTLDLKAPLASPALTGTPTAPTAVAGTNTTQLATTSFVANAVSSATGGNVATATKIQTARTIGISGDGTWSVTFDGTTNVSSALTLTSTGVAAGTYKSVTVDAKGRVTAATNPTTIAGYGITDAVNKGGDTMTGALSFTAAATAPAASTPTALSNGKLQSFGPLIIAADTDATLTENLLLSSGVNAPTSANGLSIGYNSITWKDNAVWHAGNDGAGSGLDADLLDGLSSNYYFQRQSSTIVSGSDWNTFTTIGTYKVQGAVNTDTGAPPFTYAYGLLNVYKAADNDTEARTVQVYIPHTTDKNIYLRMYNNGAWVSWKILPVNAEGRIVWHSENDGAGSGLDADLLDGQQGSYYAPIASPAITGVPTAPTAAVNTNTTQLATTQFVLGQVGTATPIMNGTAAVGTSYLYARQDHVHAIDTSRAPLASPALTGTPTAPTAVSGTNTTQLATTAFVATAVAGLVNAAPAALDTLNELATALGNDANFSTTVTNNLALKAPIASPTFTGTATIPTANITTLTVTGNAQVNGNLYLKASGDNTDAMYIVKNDIAADLSELDIYLGDNPVGSVITAPSVSSADYLAIKSTGGIHHLFGSDGTYVAATSITAPTITASGYAYATTATAGDSSTKLATTSFVGTAIATIDGGTF